MVVVLPVPAPASINSGPRVCCIASSCLRVDPVSSSSSFMLSLLSCLFVNSSLSVFILPISPPLKVFLYEVPPHKTTSIIQPSRPRAYTSDRRSHGPRIASQNPGDWDDAQVYPHSSTYSYLNKIHILIMISD